MQNKAGNTNFEWASNLMFLYAALGMVSVLIERSAYSDENQLILGLCLTILFFVLAYLVRRKKFWTKYIMLVLSVAGVLFMPALLVQFKDHVASNSIYVLRTFTVSVATLLSFLGKRVGNQND